MTSQQSCRLLVGLNPYGLAYTLGLQGAGTPRARPDARGLDDFLQIAREIDARCVEFDWRWLLALTAERISEIGASCREADRRVLVSAWLQQQAGETLVDVFRVAHLIGAPLVRLHLTPVLEGGRSAAGPRWHDYIAHARATLIAEAVRAADAGLNLGIENHQDFGSEELLELAETAGGHVGLVLDTGNPFAVGEDPVAFTRRACHRIWHVHFKDYRAQFTPEGFRLVRCAIGDGCVPLEEIMAVLLSSRSGELTASLEPGALEARHVRLFTRDWWRGYASRDAAELGEALGRLRHRRLDDDEDCRTPWERQAASAEIVDYELGQLRRSLEHLRALGWMPGSRA